MTNPKEIIYISRAIFPSQSANSIHLMKMCQAFAKICDNVFLIGFSCSKTKISDEEIFKFYNISFRFNLKLFKLPLRGSKIYFPLCVFSFLLLKSRRSKIIYSREPAVILISALLGFKSILEMHDFFDTDYRRQLEKLIFRNKNFLKLVVISNILKQDYLSYFPHICNNIEVLPDGADIETTQDFISTEWKSKDKSLSIGYFGHLYKGRGIEIIIDLAKSIEWAEFHVIGGLESDVMYYRQLEDLPDNILFYGFKQQHELSYLRSKCDILLMPYQEDLSTYNSNLSTARWMSPMKLFEYLSTKKAIISSDLPVIREILNDSNSILVPPNDLQCWIKAIQLLSDATLRERISSKAYDDFVNYYTWDIRAKNVLKMFK